MTQPFYASVADDFERIDSVIKQNLGSEVPLVEEIAQYLIDAGGKRLRPLLVLLSARACGYNRDAHIPLAAVIEFLHTAMLLHDDVVDESLLRRGRKTVNAAWGNPASVLVGDFLHSRAFQMMVQIGDIPVMDILSAATNVISEGEVQQLVNVRNPDITEASYLQVIERKTATLFEAASHSGASLASAAPAQRDALRDYGRHLGMAFQLVDDVLDYSGSTEDLGKNVGDDLAEGKATLPLIYALRHGDEASGNFIRSAIREGGLENLDEIIQTVQDAGGLEYTANLAERERDNALDCLAVVPESEYQTAMCSLANFSIERSF